MLVDSLVFLDVETTGLNASMDRIIEIHLLKLDLSGKVMEYGTLLNPQRPLPPEITKITGLTDHDLKDSPLEGDVAATIRDFIDNGTPVAHNLQFDLRFINALFHRTRQDQIRKAGIDTLALSRKLFPKLCIYPDGGGSHRLSNLMYHFGLEEAFANSHRARDDVLLLVEVYRKLQDYAKGRNILSYPAAITHGCPTCGSAMHLVIEGARKTLICSKRTSCRKELVV